jgi:site-specific DNA-cytosine methylase
MTESGLIVPEYLTRKPKHLTAFDFFCGCGGFNLGFISSGDYEIVGANEWDANASLTYLANLGHYPCRIHYIEGEKDKARLDKAVRSSWGIKGDAPIEEQNLSKAWMVGSGWLASENNSGKDISGVKNFWFDDMRKLKGKDILDELDMKRGDIDIVMGGVFRVRATARPESIPWETRETISFMNSRG